MSEDFAPSTAAAPGASGLVQKAGLRNHATDRQPTEEQPSRRPVSGGIDAASRRAATATLALIGINVLIYIANLASGNAVTLFGALVPLLVVRYQQWWRLIVSGFLHADLMHIGLNLYAFYGLGQLAERFFGKKQLIAIYGFSLLGASTLVTLFSPLNTPTVGASGAIMGVLGALVALFWTYREELAGGRGFLNRLIQMALINIGIGLLPGISWWGHLGGFVFGALTGLLLLPRFERRCISLPTGEVRCFLMLKDTDHSHKPRLRLSLIAIGELALLALAVGLRG